MESCEACRHYLECQKIDLPNEVIAAIIDMMWKQWVDEKIEAALVERFGIILQERNMTMRLLRKHILEFEESCRAQEE